MRPAFSAVVLCYRAGQRARPFAGQVIEVLSREMDDWELVLVANYLEGVVDETPRALHEIAATDPRIKMLARPKEGMMGWDVRTGLEAASGEVLGFRAYSRAQGSTT